MLLGTDKLAPTFFIGLGGSGGRVVDVLARRLAAEATNARFLDLLHFLVVDTDQNDLDRIHGRVLKSNIALAHKPRRIALHRGEEAGLPEDRRVTSWVHPWYRFREQSNAGAGQIRLEARYSLHAQLAQGAPDNVEQLVRHGLQRALRAREPNRASERIRFHIFASLAGGTGSGASLIVANLLRKLAAEQGAQAEVFGHFLLPSLFRDKVASPLVPKINANGYAALKEIERAQELRYEGGPEELELVFHPGGSQGRTPGPADRVRQAPFDWVYVIDRPEAMAIEEIYAAAGEAAYLQLFTPILGYQEREADNFRQLQTRLAAGYFALQNGAIGASVIEFPRERLVKYCARQWSMHALGRFVIAGSDEGQGLIHDPEFQALSETEQGRRLDEGFVTFVATEARAEDDVKRPGPFAEIARLESQGTNLLTALRKRFELELQAAEDEVDIDSINAAAVTPENTSLNAARDNLGRDVQRVRQALAVRAAAFERDLASGQWLTKFFETFQVSPLGQRRLLIEIDRLARDEVQSGLAPEDRARAQAWCFSPYEDPEAAKYLVLQAPDPATWRVDQPEIRRQIERLEGGLEDAARRLFKKEQAFGERRHAVVSFFNSLRDTARDAMIVEFWQRIARALEAQVAQRLDVFRAMAKQGMALLRHLGAESERCRARGLAVPAIGTAGHDAAPPAAADFHLGSEVFHDERAGVRAWDHVWSLAVRPYLQIATTDILAVINRHLQAAAAPRKPGEAAPQARELGQAQRVLHEVAADLDRLGQERVARLLSVDRPLGLANGLVMEARLAALEYRVADLGADGLEALGRAPTRAVSDYLREKIGRVAAMSRALGRFDEPVLAGREFSPYRPRFYGIALEHLRHEPLIGDALGLAASGFERLEDWNSPDLVSFYQATLGVPLYAWVEVAGPLARAYDHEVRDGARHEPLQIDHRWEEPGFHGAPGPGLPGLDPGRRQAWEARVQALGDRALGGFVTALAAGVVTASEGAQRRWSWGHRGKSGDLGLGAAAAMSAWACLPDGLQAPLTEAATEALGHGEAARARLESARKRVAGWRFDAEADGQTLEAQALGKLLQALERARAPVDQTAYQIPPQAPYQIPPEAAPQVVPQAVSQAVQR